MLIKLYPPNIKKQLQKISRVLIKKVLFSLLEADNRERKIYFGNREKDTFGEFIIFLTNPCPLNFLIIKLKL